MAKARGKTVKSAREPVSEGETESAVRNSPYTVHGCRPTSVVVQPARTATNPSGATHRILVFAHKIGADAPARRNRW